MQEKALARTQAAQAAQTTAVVFEGTKLAITRQDRHLGLVQAYKAKVPLTQGIDIITIGSGDKQKAMITATGAYKANQMAALSIKPADHVVVGDKVFRNPYNELDSLGIIKSVSYHALVGGYAPNGTPSISHAVVTFNLYAYFIQDLMACIEKYPDCGALGDSMNKPKIRKHKPWSRDGNAAEKEVALNENLTFIPTQDLGGIKIGLWVDLTKREVTGVYSTTIQRQKFAERMAQTMAERNALKKHPATGGLTPQQDANGNWYVGVFGTIPVDDVVQKAMARAQRGDLEGDDSVIIDAQTVEIIDAGRETITGETEEQRGIVEEIHAEETAAGAAAEQQTVKPGSKVEIPESDELDLGGDDVMQPEPEAPKKPSAPVPPSTENRESMKLLTQIFEGKAIVGAKAFNAAIMPHVGDVDIKTITDIPTLKKCLSAVNAAADAGV